MLFQSNDFQYALGDFTSGNTSKNKFHARRVMLFAIFLIIAASGVLNIASISSVFNIKIYKPLARLSALLAIALLTGGLIVLV